MCVAHPANQACILGGLAGTVTADDHVKLRMTHDSGRTILVSKWFCHCHVHCIESQCGWFCSASTSVSVHAAPLGHPSAQVLCCNTCLCVECTGKDLEEEEGRVSAVVMADWVTMHAGHTWLHPALLQLAQQVSFLPSTAACCGHQC